MWFVTKAMKHMISDSWRNGQSIRVRPVYIVSKCFNFHLMLVATLFYSKFAIIHLQREESAAKSNE